MGVLFLLIPYNVIVDFFSLAETRWILRRSKPRLGSLLALTVVDLVLTGLIYILPASAILYAVGVSQFERFGLLLLTTQIGWPFFLTTFLTSSVWILFAGSSIAMRLLDSVSFTRRVLREMYNSDRPTVAFSWLGYLTVAALAYPIVLLLSVVPPVSLPQGPGDEPPAIAVGRIYAAHFTEGTLQHRASFQGRAGVTYVIDAQAPLLGDPMLRLFLDAEEIDRDDDSGDGTNARIRYRSERDSIYVVEIAPYRSGDLSPVAGGPSHVLYLSVQEEGDMARD